MFPPSERCVRKSSPSLDTELTFFQRVTIGTGQIGSQAAVAASILPGSSVIVPGQETVTNATESQTVAAGLAATAVAINREGSGSRVSAGLALPLFAIPLALVTMVSLL